jgi:hypothetical protein
VTSHPTHTVDRAHLITGLRQLADYLDTHPAIPVTASGWDLLSFPQRHGDDQAERAEVDRVADLLGREVCDDTTYGGHYVAARTFGPVTYRFVHVPARRRALHKAHMSYTNAVTPDESLEEAR